MKKLPLNVLYRLYKAEAGDTIDNTYVRLTGGWMTNDDRSVDDNGLLQRNTTYQFAFKDLSDGQYYQTSQSATEVIVPDSFGYSVVRYKEPFSDPSNYPLSVNTFQYSAIRVSVSEYTEALEP
ncbi:hypothetical protein [Serratia fonticola]|uniref:hypothetical protein n=1 Tax=Serratia fonticola TaxID=47917 RepID=UPI00217A44F4|nr:hypothetical protein [Serratia fonticola]CAI1591454.1 Uncharacterised protein [Serratia fonticola]CAI1624599.1 Uncharacterised protein [Serratia fonticola]CAI1728955.1 Uncharacterised protein [Serratia fonticola]CAI1797401.1 Uncharacterised protein [Serratia fonticola]HBE9178283.1 hypothetical protein [Serratia fonticola]